MDWLVDLIYYVDESGNPLIFKSFLALFGLMFMLTFLLEVFNIIKSAGRALGR